MFGRRGDVGPWYERNDPLVVAVLVALYALVLGARYVGGSGPHAVSVLYVFPVSLMALVWGLRGGLFGSAFAVVGMVIPEVFGVSHLDALSWATRLSAIVLLGLLLGSAQDRARRSQLERLREHEEQAVLRCQAAQATAAAEIGDSLVQGMSSAKWLIELGKPDEAVDILADTIEQAQVLVSGLVDREVGEPPGTYLRAVAI